MMPATPANFDMQLDAKAIGILSQVTTATLTTILLKKGGS